MSMLYSNKKYDEWIHVTVRYTVGNNGEIAVAVWI
jgi:hypothetical protein